MNPTQSILAARDAGDWSNILFIVLMAVFYAAGSIIKSIKAKKENQDGQPAPKPHPARPHTIRPAQQTPRRQPQRPVAHTSHRLQIPPAYRKTAHPKPAVHKPAKIAPQVQAGTEKFPAFTGETAGKNIKPGTVEILKDKRTDISPTAAHTEYALELSSADDLRKAILHYEILGKPLALRKPIEF